MREDTVAADAEITDTDRARNTLRQRLVAIDAVRVALSDAVASAEIIAEHTGRFDELHHLGLAFIGADRTVREFSRLAEPLLTSPAPDPDGEVEW